MTPDANPTERPSALPEHQVMCRKEEAVAIVEFSRAPSNFFNVELLRDIADVLDRIDRDDSIRATVLTSTGKNFCAGADLAGEANDPRELYAQAERLFGIRKPCVAAVQGAAIGGGLGLCLFADFRVVTPQSKLSANFVKLGMSPGFALTLTLPRLVGAQMANLLLLTGRRIGGEEALHIGLADAMADPEDLLEAAISLATEIAENAPLAVESTRSLLREDLVARVRAQTSRESHIQLVLKDTEDFHEGVRAVKEKHKGNWKRR